ncbi:unnamed protein product [Brachionus calyciflorus]|uniref:Fe2OG dioxygenase domain-containing protein n=1 Tax=Brachionus calyciflorus TaxID=104777 RepID=A0A813QYR6_9BILA|nr:unnamed protein product [Brachionus calyciflorus]
MYEDTKIVENDLFMKEFKIYKQIKSFDDLKKLNQCVFLDNLDPNLFNAIELNLNSLNEEDLKTSGLRPFNEIKCYELKSNPGLLVIPNPFENGYQRFLIKKCLYEYHDPPNKTNLDLHMKRDGNLWTNALKCQNFGEFNKLRWTTIGYHYDWTNKVYNELDYTDPPVDVAELSRVIAALIGYKNYKPEAGIINYYHLNSTLSAHQDHSEKNMNAPLISISLGSSAVFLIGTTTKTEKPVSLLLRSGDVVIMSEKARLAYHAVPKILADPEIDNFFQQNNEMCQSRKWYVSDQEWNNFYNYIKINRINLNIRQVNNND